MFVYDLSGNSERMTTKLSDGATISQSITNGFGQMVVDARPNSLNGFIYTRSEFNAKGQVVKSYQDTGWNTEKTAATLFEYDALGNRQFTLEDNTATMYDTNALNQYTAISKNGAAAFVPQFDTDGNQTLIKTETGIWSVVYNAENRPVSFTKAETGTMVECQYDSMGRRAYKKVTNNGSVVLHQRYIYRGYLQIACIDLARSHHPALWYITWDPPQPIATRPLAIQNDGTWFTYGWDLTKNVCELYSSTG